jgi:hypothetical protein
VALPDLRGAKFGFIGCDRGTLRSVLRDRNAPKPTESATPVEVARTSLPDAGMLLDVKL